VSSVFLALLASCNGLSWARQLELHVSCELPDCGWQVDVGSIERTGSWSPTDFAFSLLDTPTRISRSVSVTTNPSCLHFSYVGDIAATAGVELLLDFNDDGIDDARAPLPPANWKRSSVTLTAPAEYQKLRVSLLKSGAGVAKLALFAMKTDEACNATTRTTLVNGSQCAADATCSSQRCLLGRCSACGAGGCVEGEACRDSNECMDGACAAQVCRKCAKQGACGASEGCSAAGQCAASSCIAGSVPSLTKQPALDASCGECDDASDCGGKPCMLGRCAACATDSDCTGGLSCRWLDPFDALQRGCVPKTTSPRPRGALCEFDSECEGALPCGAGEGRAKRCGFACGKQGDCGDTRVCVAPGARTVSEEPERYSTLPAWSELAGRIATCWPRVTFDMACQLHQQCTGLSLFGSLTCCAGECGSEDADFGTGMCAGPNPEL
jgi:hypothetical protein